MTKVTCLGDSIRLQYTPVATTLLGDEFQVFSSSDNCRYVKYTLRALYDWNKDIEGSRIVHWNNGLWDVSRMRDGELFSSKEEYVANMLRIANHLLKNHEIVIFATITPVRPEHANIQNQDIIAFNEALVPKLREKGVRINDLYSLVATDPARYICDDYIHLSEEGIDLCAQAVADAIRTAAETL